MSNLSELLPTGGGQNAVDFVASGTLSSGQTVALKSDGTVEAVTETPVSQSLGSSATFESGRAINISAAFDSLNNKVIVACKDFNNSDYGTAVVGTISGTSISFGTPVVFESAATTTTAATFDVSQGKVVIAYRDQANSNYGTAIVGTVSGTSISFGSAVVFQTSYCLDITAIYDSTNQKIVIAYRNVGSSNQGTAIVGTVSGTSISFGSSVVFDTNECSYIGATYDSSNNAVVIAYQDSTNSSYGTAIVGSVSGTSISFGTKAVYESADSAYNSPVYDSSSQKVGIFYKDGGNSNYGTYVVATVSGTSISFSGANVFVTGTTEYISSVYDSNANKIVIFYRNGSLSNVAYVISGAISGTSISFDTATQVSSGTSSSSGHGIAFDSSNNKTMLAYADGNFSNSGLSKVFQPAYNATNSADFIGITAEAISDTATGAVNVYGGINEAQTGLTIGSDYYVQADGSLSTTASDVKVGQAISATTINMMDLT